MSRIKWEPVFRKGHAPLKEARAHPDLVQLGCALELPLISLPWARRDARESAVQSDARQTGAAVQGPARERALTGIWPAQCPPAIRTAHRIGRSCPRAPLMRRAP